MAIKNTSFVFLLCVMFLLTQAKHAKKDDQEEKQKGIYYSLF